MPRASNIYILQRRSDGLIKAGWTVKGEMEYWLKERDESREVLETTYLVICCRDGFGTGHATIVPWGEIL